MKNKLLFVVFLILISSYPSADEFDCTRHIEFGAPRSSGPLLCHEGYISSFNTTSLVPNWVAYYMDSKSIIPETDGPYDFKPDPSISVNDQASLYLYKGSTFDRGQLAPVASMDFTATSRNEAFLFTNVAPQHPGLNRAGWAQLEEHFRECAMGQKKGIMVIAGPVFGKYTEFIKGEIRIPFGFFMVAVSKSSPYLTAAYLMPNQPVSRNDIGIYRTTVDHVEEITRFDFFNMVPLTNQDRNEAELSGLCSIYSKPVGETDTIPSNDLLENLKEF